MNFISGIGLAVFAVLMIWVGRPKAGHEYASFLRSWAVGQLYVVVAMICLVMGASLIISAWPSS